MSQPSALVQTAGVFAGTEDELEAEGIEDGVDSLNAGVAAF